MHYIITLSLLIAVLLLIRGIFRNKLDPVVMYALWLVLIIKLCVPISLFEVDFSAFRKSEVPSESLYEIIDDTYFYENEVEDSSDIAPVTESISNDKTNMSSEKEQIKTEDKANAKAPVASVEKAKAPSAKIDKKSLFKIIWTVGAELIALWFISTSLIFAFGVHRDRKLIGKFKGVKVYISEKARTPCVFGFIPSIYLTNAANESDERELILLHEYTHLCHGDNLWAIVRTAVLIFHWWNPLVWAAALLSKQDGEIACDNTVTRTLDEARKKKYAYMLIDMIPKKPTFATGFANNSIKERIIMMTNSMTKKRKSNALITILAVSLIIFAASCSFIGEEQAGESKELFPKYGKYSVSSITSIDYFKYDGENMHTATIEDKAVIDNLMNELYSVNAEKSDGFKRGEKTIYGLRLNQTDNKKSTFDRFEYLFIDKNLITKDGTCYKFDYALTRIEENHLESAPEASELSPEFPCLWHLALDGDDWNQYYMPTRLDNVASGVLTNGVEMRLLKFFGKDLEFEYVDNLGHSYDQVIMGNYNLQVLIGTKWYAVPYAPSFEPELHWVMRYNVVDGVRQDGERILTSDFAREKLGIFEIPIETPTGYYRLTGGGYSHDLVINKDVRENIIDVNEIGGIERIDSQIREIIPELYYGEPFEGGYVYSDYTLLGLEREKGLIRATVAICHRNFPNSSDPTEFIGRTYPAIITFKEENGKYVIESTISPETAWKDVTKHLSEGIIIDAEFALILHMNKAVAGAIEYYGVDPYENIKSIIDDAFEYAKTTENMTVYGSPFKQYGVKLGYYGEYAIDYFFNEYLKGESEGIYDDVLKALLPYATGINKNNMKSFSEIFEQTYSSLKTYNQSSIVKYSPVAVSFFEKMDVAAYNERYYINHPEAKASVKSKTPLQLDTDGLKLLFTYNHEKIKREYYFYETEGEPKRFKVGYKNEEGYLIPDTMSIPSQYKYEDAEPLLMTYKDGELFYVVKLTYGDEVTYLKNVCISDVRTPLGPNPPTGISEITAEEAEALLAEQKG